MNIPTSVKVGGHFLNVVTTNNCDLIAYNEIGKTTLAKDIIYLNANYSESRKQEAFLHELIHNCFYDINEEQIEDLICRLGTSIYMIIVDNPEIFK